MRRLLVRAGIALAAILVIALIGASAYVYRVYFAHLGHVETVLATLPSAEANPPEAFARAVHALDADSYSSWVARSFVAETAPTRSRMLEWHLRNLIWSALLPRNFSQEQLLALYAHFLQFEGGRGLVYGARQRFSQDPAALTLRQFVELLVISRAPSVYSGAENRGRLDSQVERQMARLNVPAA
jgi:transglycosylase-like protein